MMKHNAAPGAKKIAVVLISGGLDSAVTLFDAKKQHYACVCLIFDYGQRHKKEIERAKRIARFAGCPWRLIKIVLPWKGSSLLDTNVRIPEQANKRTSEQANIIPSTYVPGRNIVFLSYALSYAEAIHARAIFIGAHAQDYSGYPDCRPEFFRAFQSVVTTGTKCGVEKKGIVIKTPLLHKSKADIIRLGRRLGVPFRLTWSCYRGGKSPCGTCDSCFFRAKGFKEAGMKDPSLA